MKLYVGNLPFTYTEEELSELFAEFGSIVSAKLIIDRDTNKSKGFGFVEMGSQDEGEAAIKQLNGKEVSGRSIVVNEARPPKKREGGGSSRSFQKRRF